MTATHLRFTDTATQVAYEMVLARLREGVKMGDFNKWAPTAFDAAEEFLAEAKRRGYSVTPTTVRP